MVCALPVGGWIFPAVSRAICAGSSRRVMRLPVGPILGNLEAMTHKGRQSEEAWRLERLAMVPAPWRERVRKLHAGKLSKVAAAVAGTGTVTELEQAANLWLLDLTEGFGRLRVRVDLSDSELCALAAEKARQAFSLVEIAPGGVMLSEPGALRARLSAFCSGYGIKPPGETVEDGPALARMTCAQWWRRGLRVSQARQLEAAAIGLGYVHKRAEIYASNATVERRRQQRARNEKALENTQAVNLDTGEAFALSDLAGRSVANPRIRRGELMTRISGFEAVAKGLGHEGIFLTITAPGAYHKKATANGGVFDNPNHNGATPRQAQEYLVGMWANARAALWRAGAKVYGFRIAEPHHDGTPHWHLLLFVDPEKRADALRIIAKYARRANPEEMTSREAKKARFDSKLIDWKRGTAAGYVAKYVSKNIDGGGFQVQGDFEGDRDAVTPSHRVEAWASTWGIRQFQQVGGPPVGVWRELRRLPAGGEYSALVESARAAADCGRNGKDETGTAGNWRRYVELMGGPVVARAELPIRVAYTAPGERWNFSESAPYSAAPNRYGEAAAPVPYGVRYMETVTQTLGIAVWRQVVEKVAYSARYRWAVMRKGLEDLGGLVRGVACAIDSAASGFLGFVAGEAGRAWTRVNNCSADFLQGAELARWIEKNGNAWAALPSFLREKIGGVANEHQKEGGTGGEFVPG